MSSRDAERGGQVCILNLLPHAVHSVHSPGLSPFLPTPPGKTTLPVNLVFISLSLTQSLSLAQGPWTEHLLCLVFFQIGGYTTIAVCH